MGEETLSKVIAGSERLPAIEVNGTLVRMTKLSRLCCFLLVTFSLAPWMQGAVSLAPLFSEHAVLQRDKPVAIWGTAEAGEPVEISFQGQRQTAVADVKGRWEGRLAAMPASILGATLKVKGLSSEAVATDVVVGDVWLCSGQSNMEWPVSMSNDAEKEMASAMYPLIRHFKVERAKADVPLASVTSSGWAVCSPQTVGGFTAVGYFFARELQTRLHIPIAIINTSWGGTPIEAWMSPESFQKEPALAGIVPRWESEQPGVKKKIEAYEAALATWTAAEAAAKAAGKKFAQPKPEAPGEMLYPNKPGELFNGMVQPLVPSGLTGFLWYQGESNTGRPKEYQTLLTSMISDWRHRFGQGDLPFYFVQLANFKGWNQPMTSWAYLRESQTKALALPATGQAITIDIGMPNDVHPKNKQEVGRRLALLARARVYGQNVDDSGPVFARMERGGNALKLFFNYTAGALTAHERPLAGFEIAGADRVYHKATAKLVGETVVLSAKEVKEPVAVRYAWHNIPEGNLYNGAGLPAGPFRTDDWE